jgi:hypothetical protein
MAIAMSINETDHSGLKAGLNLNSPFRMPSPKNMTTPQLDKILEPLFEATTEELLTIRERTYTVLDRMDELETAGQNIPVLEFEEILRGAAIIEQLLAERMQGLVRGKGNVVRKAEGI